MADRSSASGFLASYLFKSITRAVMPIGKSEAKALGTALNAGANLLAVEGEGSRATRGDKRP